MNLENDKIAGENRKSKNSRQKIQLKDPAQQITTNPTNNQP